MNRGGIVRGAVLLLLLCAFPVFAQQNRQSRETEANYLKDWPAGEVAYIISSEEETAFKVLKTDEERVQFMEQFWLRRDPTPDTVDNEYRDAYYTRIAQSNERLILADIVETLPPRTVASPFQIGSHKVRPSVKSEFRRDQDLNVFLQVYGLKVDESTHKASVTTELLIRRDQEEVLKFVDETGDLAGASQQLNVVRKIPMSGFDAGQYEVLLKVKDNLAESVQVARARFTVR